MPSHARESSRRWYAGSWGMAGTSTRAAAASAASPPISPIALRRPIPPSQVIPTGRRRRSELREQRGLGARGARAAGRGASLRPALGLHLARLTRELHPPLLIRDLVTLLDHGQIHAS